MRGGETLHTGKGLSEEGLTLHNFELYIFFLHIYFVCYLYFIIIFIVLLAFNEILAKSWMLFHAELMHLN